MLVTRTEAAAKHCPFKFTLTSDPDKVCWNVNCMAWKKAPPCQLLVRKWVIADQPESRRRGTEDKTD